MVYDQDNFVHRFYSISDLNTAYQLLVGLWKQEKEATTSPHMQLSMSLRYFLLLVLVFLSIAFAFIESV